jgi:hypothetical protein
MESRGIPLNHFFTWHGSSVGRNIVSSETLKEISTTSVWTPLMLR